MADDKITLTEEIWVTCGAVHHELHKIPAGAVISQEVYDRRVEDGGTTDSTGRN